MFKLLFIAVYKNNLLHLRVLAPYLHCGKFTLKPLNQVCEFLNFPYNQKVQNRFCKKGRLTANVFKAQVGMKIFLMIKAINVFF